MVKYWRDYKLQYIPFMCKRTITLRKLNLITVVLVKEGKLCLNTLDNFILDKYHLQINTMQCT